MYECMAFQGFRKKNIFGHVKVDRSAGEDRGKSTSRGIKFRYFDFYHHHHHQSISSICLKS